MCYQTGMIVQLCKVAVTRLGDGGRLVNDLREREHQPVIKDCLDRCTTCETGVLVASAGGTPVSLRTATELLAKVDALAAEEDDA